jgi:EAL domain-containing protein (putative c-di-GMP-specific phosphodiesterase class I)
VETAEVFDELRLLGCDLVQGHFVGSPLAADELEQWMQDRRRDLAEAFA